MFPYFEFLHIKIFVFPFALLFAMFVPGIVCIKSQKYPNIFLLDIMKKFILVIFGAAIGARLMSAITLISILDKTFLYNLLFGGSVFYGGIIGGCVALSIVCAIKKQPFLEYTDVFASLIPLGQAIGRIGCYFNGCCYGCKYEGFCSIIYPVNGKFIRVFPTWFVEAVFCTILFLFFQFICKTTIRGRRTSIYFIAYSSFRFLIEYVRGDEVRGMWVGITTSQIVSVLILIFGIGLLIYSSKNKKYNYMILT